MDESKTTTYTRAVILTGGDCDLASLAGRGWLPRDAYVIGADSGVLKAAPLGLTPHLLVGDFDSIPKERLGDYRGIEVITAPCEKDETDTMLACDLAIARGCRELWIVGGFGGRCDHQLSNVFFLENLRDRGIRATMTDGNGKISVIMDERAVLPRHEGYFSVFALDQCRVTLTGCKYPLTEALLTRSNPYGVSNEITAEEAVVTVWGKALLCDVEVARAGN